MEVTFFYNSNQLKERKTLAYIKSLDQHIINDVDIHKNTLTERQLSDIALKMDKDVKDLLDEKSEYYKDNLSDSQIDNNDILILLKKNPTLLKTPIIQFGDTADFVDSAYDFNKIDMEAESNKDELSNRDETDKG